MINGGGKETGEVYIVWPPLDFDLPLLVLSGGAHALSANHPFPFLSFIALIKFIF